VDNFGTSALAALAILLILGLYTLVYVCAQAITAWVHAVGVKELSVGFGPRLCRFRFKGADCSFRLVLLGGYTRFFDDDAPEGVGNGQNGERPAGMAGMPYSRLDGIPKILVLSVGPVSNLAIGVLVWTLSACYGQAEDRFMHERAQVGWCRPGSSLAKAGLRRGDVIVSARYGGHSVAIRTWGDLSGVLKRAIGGPLELDVQRPSGTIHFAASLERSVLPAVCHDVPPQVGRIASSSRAAIAGLQQGDLVVSVDHRPVEHWLDVTTALFPPDSDSSALRKPVRQIVVDIERNGEKRSLTIDPTALAGKPSAFGLMAPDEPTVWVADGLGDAFTRSLSEVAVTIDEGLRLLTTGGAMRFGRNDYLRRSIELSRTGISRFVVLVGTIGVWLGFTNLVPIPPLNGATILLECIAVILGRRPSDTAVGAATVCGSLIWVALLVWIGVSSWRGF